MWRIRIRKIFFSSKIYFISWSCLFYTKSISKSSIILIVQIEWFAQELVTNRTKMNKLAGCVQPQLFINELNKPVVIVRNRVTSSIHGSHKIPFHPVTTIRRVTPIGRSKNNRFGYETWWNNLRTRFGTWSKDHVNKNVKWGCGSFDTSLFWSCSPNDENVKTNSTIYIYTRCSIWKRVTHRPINPGSR